MLVYGRNVAITLLQHPQKVQKVYLQEQFDDKRIISLLEKSKIPIETRKKYALDQLADGVHQGIILSIEDYQYQPFHELPLHKEDAFIVILDHLEDPHNLGAIVRTAEAAGVDAIMIPKDRGVAVTPTVMKTSAGALDLVPITMVTNLTQAIEKLKKQGFWIVGTDMEDSVDYRSIDYQGKIALVIGSEGKGMSRLVRESCDFVARIPMFGKVNSLNASVASGIMIYEVVRNRK